AISILVCAIALAQDKGQSGGTYPRARASNAARGERPNPAGKNHIAIDKRGHPDVPHVHAGNDQWAGHNSGANDSRYHLVHLWAHGRFWYRAYNPRGWEHTLMSSTWDVNALPTGAATLGEAPLTK
ncbi:MAG: hypothetical protein QOJ99_2131, partial [Bryobacterales bacterium]|nr:hypothetical protein [Bryobacterales bacterium]